MNDKLPPLNLPAANLKIVRDGDVIKVFDSLRKKYVVLTPEEYVRQTFIHYLTERLGYPPEMIAVEKSLNLNGVARRYDTVVFRPDGEPLVILEFKAPYVKINQDVFDQIARYNMVLHSRYLVVSNGINHYCCKMDYDRDTYNFIPSIPDFASLMGHNPSEN